MPRVEVYGKRVPTRPVSGTKAGPVPTPDVYGAELGEVGQRISGQWASEVLRVRADEQQRANQLAVVEAEQQFNQLDQVYLHSEDMGLLKKVGMAPHQQLEKHQEQWDENADKIVGTATTETQRIALTALRDRRRMQFHQQADAHATREYDLHEKGTYRAALVSSKNAAEQATLSAAGATLTTGEPAYLAVVRDQLALQESIVRAGGVRVFGSPAEQQALIEKYRSDTHVGIVKALLSKRQPKQAQAYFAEHVTEIETDSAATLRELINPNVAQQEAFDAGNAVWNKYVTDAMRADPNSVIPMQQIEAELRTQFATDPDGYKMAIAYARDLHASLEQERNDTTAARNDVVNDAIQQGATLAQASALPEWALMTGTQRLQAATVIQQRQERAVDRARQATERARGETDRAYMLRQRARLEQEERGKGAYYALRIRPDFASLTPAYIRTPAVQGALGPEWTARTLAELEQVQKSATAGARQEIQREDFQQIAYDAGLDYAYEQPGKLKEPQKARLGQLLAAVNLEISQKTAQLKRALTREETRDVMTAIVHDTVMLNTWGSDEAVIRATVLQNEAGLAYVPLADIPSGTDSPMERMLNYLRTIPDRAGTAPQKRLNDDQLKMAYKDRLQRAYGATLMGATKEDADAILKGER